MDLPNNNGKQESESLSMNIAPESFVFADQINNFDSNITSSNEYCTSIQGNSTPQQTVIAPFRTITSDYNEVPSSNSNISLVPSSEIPNDCITYSNVIFVPSIANNGNQIDSIELVKNEIESTTPEITNSSTAFKYVVSSDPHFVNTFIQTNNVDSNNATVLNNSTDGNFNDLMVNGISNENSQINHRMQHVEPIESNQMAVQMQSTNDQEVLLQDEHGQLYRQIHNIYVDGASMCTTASELLPIISTPIEISDVGYPNHNIERLPSNYQEKSDPSTFQIPANFVTNSNSNDRHSDTVNTNAEMQEVEFIFNSYRNTRPIGDISESSTIGSNQYETNPAQNYQSQIHSNKEQQSLLESTMSTLLAAVNDIAAREEAAREEQFQSYLNTGKSVPDQSLEYYSESRTENISSMIYSTAPTKPPEVSKDSSKSLTFDSIASELYSNRCESPASEYVDINEFIEKKNEEGKEEENVLIRRSPRKKTTKRKNDELLITDKFVPSRALASLPTTYLYFETMNGNGPNRQQQRVLAKRDIPLQMKFGPIVGDTKTFNKPEMSKYREMNSEHPSLLLGHDTILDVSNENTSNWMRFVRLATKHGEQNLLLCEIDSQLYFKCCRFIAPKQELRVGYSKDYAKKYDLTALVPEPIEKPTEFVCKKCDERFASNKLLQNHQDDHKASETNVPAKLVPRITPSKLSDTSSPTKSKDRLNTGAIRKRKLALSKNSRTSGPTVRYACCYCSKVFSTFLNYKKHTNMIHSVNIEHKRVTVDAEHKRLTIEDSVTKIDEIKEEENDNINAKKLFVCQKCQQHFMTAKELEDHDSSKCYDKDSVSLQCDICLKHLQTPSALTMHIRTHSTKNGGICKCPFCAQRYQSTSKFQEHVKTHMINDIYSCPHCAKEFPKYSSIRKHMKINHSSVRFVCHECGKDFKSKYKLKEHSLSHSDVRGFSCADCDKQFKRKDKLREHILRVHAKNHSPKKRKKCNTTTVTTIKDEMPESLIENGHNDEVHLSSDEKKYCTDLQNFELNKTEEIECKESPTKAKFQPKVPPTDYERFIYKCQYCMLGFKRRGMLVNHMAKRHPDIRIDSIHELNLPILKTERCFYCQYCAKVYKSSSKRKAHILKYHPGQKLPQSTRYRTDDCDSSRDLNASFSENIGSITINAHQCMWCYKQYASRSRLLQHKRKVHSKELEESYKQNQNDYFKDLNMIMDSHESQFHSQSIDDYSIRFSSEMNENVPNSVHRFHHIEYEPENRLLELSSAALEASMRDDYSFLSGSDHVNADVIGQDIMDSREDVNFKCDSNTLPQLFEGFLQ